MCNKAIVIARVTLTHRNGEKTVIEVDADASFNKFYRWYHREPGKRIKNLLRTSQRNDATDLQALAARVKQQFDNLARMPIGRGSKQATDWSARQVINIKVVVIQKRLYRKLLECASDQLAGSLPVTRSKSGGLIEPQHRGAISIPAMGYTTLAKRWQILTGKRR